MHNREETITAQSKPFERLLHLFNSKALCVRANRVVWCQSGGTLPTVAVSGTIPGETRTETMQSRTYC